MKTNDQLGPYKLLSLLGRGGMGEVWRAVDPNYTEREVAIKVVQPGAPRQLTDALVSEARTMMKLPRHTNIVYLLVVLDQRRPDAGDLTEDGQVALVMEYIPGVSLTDLVGEHPRGMPWDLAYHVLKGLFEGVAHAHRHKVIHRDLKPDNVRIAQCGPGEKFSSDHVRILDFGLARVEKEMSKNYTTGAAGTLTYMSPEQLMELPQGHFTDVYALGLITYELLTGSPPFGGPGQDSIGGMTKAIMNDPPAPPSMRRPGLGGALENAILRALRKRGEERFADAGEMADAILPLLQRNAYDPSLAAAKNQMTQDMRSAIPSGTVLDPKTFREAARSAQPQGRATQGGSPPPPPAPAPAARPAPPAPAPAKKGIFKKGCLGCLGVVAALWLLGTALQWASSSHSKANAIAQAKVPEVREIKGGSYKDLNGVQQKVDGFSLATTHVTVDQFRAFVRATRYDAGRDWEKKGKDNHPVTNVSYEDAQAYVKWLSGVTGDTWYLPSEAEYEYAAGNRGQSLAYPWGKDPAPPTMPLANTGRTPTNADPSPTLPVGTFPANDLGLRDMLGNAWEWTSTRKDNGMQKLKGGSWIEAAGVIRISNFVSRAPNERTDIIGFRVARK